MPISKWDPVLSFVVSFTKQIMNCVYPVYLSSPSCLFLFPSFMFQNIFGCFQPVWLFSIVFASVQYPERPRGKLPWRALFPLRHTHSQSDGIDVRSHETILTMCTNSWIIYLIELFRKRITRRQRWWRMFTRQLSFSSFASSVCRRIFFQQQTRLVLQFFQLGDAFKKWLRYVIDLSTMKKTRKQSRFSRSNFLRDVRTCRRYGSGTWFGVGSIWSSRKSSDGRCAMSVRSRLRLAASSFGRPQGSFFSKCHQPLCNLFKEHEAPWPMS